MKLIRVLERRLAENNNADGEDIPAEWKAYPLCWLGYGERDGCVREGSIFWHDDLLLGVIDMFYDYYAALARLLEKTHKLDGYELRVTVMPSYEDRTYVVVTYGKKVLIEDSCKAWNFSWETPVELNETLERDYEAMKNNL